ncbi:MAG: methyltransferase domain-containing protein [Candidatus Aminicenantes bacterium]|nr:methyltransferase domain-containing protein [Candidatus Aminicenantes bacterium]
MKRSTLELLCCPSCQAELSLRDEHGEETVDEGGLFCSRCERAFFIRNGVACFIDPQELEGLNRRFARFYDRISKVYALFTKMAFLPMGGERKARKEILDRLELNSGRILEVSIGSGENLPYLFESPGVGEVYGLDISAGQLARCISFINKRGWPVDLFLGAAEQLPFKAGSFDSVLHIGGINFFSGKKQAIDEMIRVARPGSKIVIADETERLAQFFNRIAGFLRRHKGEKIDVAVPLHLVPETMGEMRVDGIWKMHGQFHGYCLEFRKPA